MSEVSRLGPRPNKGGRVTPREEMSIFTVKGGKLQRGVGVFLWSFILTVVV